MSLDRKILDRIEKENLSIRPKWFFAVKNLVFGAGTLAATILGSISLALFFEVMALQGRNLTWLRVPYILAISMAVFLILGYWVVKKIDYLYKLKFVAVFLVLFFLSLASGYMTYASGEARKIERELEEIPVYAKIVPVDREIPLENYGRHRRHHRKENDEERRDGRDDDRYRDEDRRSDNNKNNRTINEERSRRFELKNEDKDEENKILEKTHSGVDADEEDSVKSEVKGVSKEAVKNETEDEEKEEIEEEKEDSDSDTVSSSKDTSEDDEPEAVDED